MSGSGGESPLEKVCSDLGLHTTAEPARDAIIVEC
jgi:hypothetical protein